MALTIQDVINVFGTAARAAELAQKHGAKWSKENLYYWHKHPGLFHVERQQFFADVIKKEAESYLVLANSILNGDGNGN